MIEIVVVMVIMSVVLIIFTSGITQAFSAESKVDTTSSAESQLVVAFQRMDKEVRYASAISTPAVQSTDPVVEFLTPDLNDSNNTCTELRLHTSTGQLQQRTWTDGASPIVPTAWQQLASSLVAATPSTPASASTPTVSVTAPFAVIGPGSVFQYQRIELAVKVTFGTNANKTSKSSDITFTAINSTAASTIQSVGSTCTGGRGVSW
jgi:type II secretory pathway pseudopilin PulG